MKINKITLFSILLLFVMILTSCSGRSPDNSNKQQSDTSPAPQESQSEPNESFWETPSTETDTKTESHTDETKNTPPEKEPKTEVINHSNMKAMWLSQFDLQSIYTDRGAQRDLNDFKERIREVLANVRSNGFNTLFLQIRPYADSFYPSEIYPPSKYVTGSYGNGFVYDPVEIIIEEAHKIHLSIHAWINPLRGMTVDEMAQINDKYTIKQWATKNNGTYVVNYNGRYYLNPAYAESRELIVDGVDEILSHYSFDGLHMDDYFYPTTAESFDSLAYNQYVSNGGNMNLKQYRSNNINLLVKDLYKTVKTHDPMLLYGISPEGNINNATDKAFADVYAWCANEGYIDYICPQIYFGLEHQNWAFDKTANIWSNIIKNENVKLIIGMTFGKALSKTDQWAGTGKDEWAKNNDVMKRCLSYTSTLDKCGGVSVFCYQYYYDPLSGNEVSETKTERDQFTELLKQSVWKNMLK